MPEGHFIPSLPPLSPLSWQLLSLAALRATWLTFPCLPLKHCTEHTVLSRSNHSGSYAHIGFSPIVFFQSETHT